MCLGPAHTAPALTVALRASAGSFGRALPPWPWPVHGWAPSVLLRAGKCPVGDLGQRRDPVPRVVTGKGQGFRDPPAGDFSCSFCSFVFPCVLSFSSSSLSSVGLLSRSFPAAVSSFCRQGAETQGRWGGCPGSWSGAFRMWLPSPQSVRGRSVRGRKGDRTSQHTGRPKALCSCTAPEGVLSAFPLTRLQRG